MSANILLIEDEKVQQALIKKLLQQLEYETILVSEGKEALIQLQKQNRAFIDLILLDLYLPDMSGLEILDIVKQQYPDLPVIVLTGSTELDDVIKAMKFGATDFLTKPTDPKHLQIAIRNALQLASMNQELARYKRSQSGTIRAKDIIGYDNGLEKVISIARKAATSMIPVHITGETGVGKELLARMIHGESSRVGKPFVAVNCGAIPQNLVESILFGHEKGAFTGATEKAVGKFKEADGGTIFLDEVGELPIDTQVKLLRVLQQKEIEPVGSSKTRQVNIRIISATNRNLQQEVALGNFREDLFFRLNVLPIEVPPLRKRKEDIIPLVHHFIKKYVATEGLNYRRISSQLTDFLQAKEWRGNIRELENTIHRALVLSEKATLDIEDVTQALTYKEKEGSNLSPSYVEETNNPYIINILSASGALKTMQTIENETILLALKHHRNHVTNVAKSLKIAKSTLYKKLNLIKKIDGNKI